MKTFKLLPRLFAVFGLMMMFAVETFADTETGYSTSTCPATTNWKTFNVGTSGVMSGSLQNNSNEDDYFKIIVAQNGILEINVTANNPNNSNFYLYSGNSCGTTVGSALNTLSGSISQTVTAATGTYYIRANRNGNANYSMSFLLKPNYTADNERDFTVQYTKNTVGDITLIGNTVLCKSSIQTASYKNGSCIAPAANDSNDAIYAKYYKLAADTNASIFNSSSANLTIPTGSTVLWATLYWQGGLNSDSIDTTTGDATLTNMTTAMNKAKTVLFKSPDTNGTYISIVSSDSKFNWNNNAANYNYYQGAADVTQYVKQSGTYQLANLIANDGNSNGGTGPYGGWSLMVVYEDLASGTSKLKNMVVYDGYKLVNSNITKTLSGFLTPLSGLIDSKFTMFATEADTTRTDTISMLNNATPTPAFVTVASNELASAIKDTAGLSVTTRSPNYDNTIGTDIHTWDVGTTVGAKNIIGNNQTTTNVKFTYGTDIYNLGLFAFSTNLYEPDVCYVENIFKGTTNISGIGAQVNKDDNLTVRVYVKNKGTDSASGVSILHQFDSSFPYKVNSTNYNNSNPAYVTVMPPITYARTTATDSAGNDLYEYNSTSLLAKINLGTGATSSSGGTFAPNTTSAVFEYNATVKIVDSNYTNVYQVGYINSVLGIDYTNNPITMKSCDGSKNSFYGYSAPVSATGDFNVVYTTNANGALSSGYYYNLPTAIASRADNYKVIALNAGTDVLKDVNATVAVELVDASSGTCSTYTPISDVKTWIHFNSSAANFSAADIINGVIIADSQAAVKFYKKAGKNVKFRISYPNDGSGGLVIMEETVAGKFHLANFPSYAGNTCVHPVTATTYNPSNGNIQGENTYTQVPQACANAGSSGASAMTQHEVNVCLECIYGASVNYACSKDDFAIRPEAFYVKLSDQNQTNFVTKQVMSNNISGAVALNLASGYKYDAEVNATNHIDNTSTSGYTTTEGIDSIWTPAGTVVTGCNDDTNKSSVLNFFNGSVEANLSVDQVGKYSLNITDDQWASVDSNVSTMTHHVSPYFITGVPDCTLNSAVTSALGTYNGCNISSNHVNSDAGITYVDTSVEYRSYDFNLTSIQMSRGQNFAGTIMGQNTWTYMNSVNVDENMSIRYFGPIKAEGKTGTLMSNYVDNCYAQPVNMDLNLTFPVTAGLPNWRYRLQEVNATNVWRDTNAIIATPSTNVSFPLVTIPQTSFLKNQSGLADMKLSLNFDRNQTSAVNPITVGLKNFQIKCQVSGNCSNRADFSTTHLPDANVTTDNNTTFVYGRIIPRDVRVFGDTTPFTANAWYEVFNTTTIGTSALPISKIDAAWSTNLLHSDANDGDGNVTVVITGTNPANAAAVNGMETYTFGTGYALGGYKAHILTKPWLWYGTNALSYLDPNGPLQAGTDNLDCLTHPCFNINVVPSIGATGSAKSTNTATKASKRSTEGGGAWKSTKDYAPAIR